MLTRLKNMLALGKKDRKRAEKSFQESVSIIMSEKEMIAHEAVKNVIKMCILNNQQLNDIQKQQAISNLDRAAHQADWFVELLRKCGYIV